MLLITLAMVCAPLMQSFAQAQSASYAHQTENVVVVTLDGMRWQEIFQGLDLKIMKKKKFIQEPDSLLQAYSSDEHESSREKLFPFLWNVVAKQGQLYGNRLKKSFSDVSNHQLFSYPGYNELFTGYPDDTIIDNANQANPHVNVFDFIYHQPGYGQKSVAAFGTWETIAYILNREHSGFEINVDKDPFENKTSSDELLNFLNQHDRRWLGVRPDILTDVAAKEYLKKYTPKVLYISFGETDEAAHAGLYEHYIHSAHAEDDLIADLWNTLQAIPQYHQKTTLIVTVDHGRGAKSKWTDHGEDIPESSQTWLAVIGPDTPALGEMTDAPPIYQSQVATTIAKLLGLNFVPQSSSAVTHPIEAILHP